MSRVPRPPLSPRRPRPGRRSGGTAERFRGFAPDGRAEHHVKQAAAQAAPLHERITRCGSVPVGPVGDAGCFLCNEADKWKYERSERQPVRDKRKDRKPKEVEDKDGLYSLMLALSKVCKHRDAAGDRMPGSDLWTWLLEPLRSLVPCEEVKFVVKCLGPTASQLPFSHDAEARRRVTAITYVEKWPHQRIEGQAALLQRIQVLPSADAARFDWLRFEVVQSHCASPTAGRACRVKAGSDLRCLAAVPLLDAGGNVLAVAKFLNRRCRSAEGWQPRFEFSQADLSTLAAFAAIFECVVPYPFLNLLGAPLHRPQARIGMNDFGIVANLQWQVPCELGGGPLSHEVWYGPVEEDDEFEGCAGHSCNAQARELWQHVPCGYMEPISEDEDLENLTFEFDVPILHEGLTYAFRVRCRNQHTSLDWSEPSLRVSACVVPPYPSQEAIQLVPISENAVQLEWAPFYASEGMSLVEYRVLAQASDGEASEQVVACFISDGSQNVETVTVTYLQPTVSYIFTVEARYPHIGSRDFTRGLTSEEFSFHTADLTLPAPQVLALDSAPVEVAGASQGAMPLLLRWPYPQELSTQLVLQYRSAMVQRRGRYQVLMWNCIHPSACVQAHLRSADDEPMQLRVLRLNLQDCSAVQLRVLMPRGSGSTASPPSAWFCPQPPSRPQSMKLRLAVDGSGGMRLLMSWDQIRAPRHVEELGAVACAVQHDFDRGNGPCATRFQVRLRMEGAPWEELSPQLLPRPRRDMPVHREAESYDWNLHDSRLATLGQLEVQMRHGNAILWSSWCESNSIRVGLEAPHPVGALLLEEVTPYCVSLCWPPFAASVQLPLEYRVQCRESDNDGDSEWHTVGLLEAGSDSNAFLRHKLKFLRPEKSYQFAIECRYQSLPALPGRLETTQLGPRQFSGS